MGVEVAVHRPEQGRGVARAMRGRPCCMRLEEEHGLVEGDVGSSGRSASRRRRPGAWPCTRRGWVTRAGVVGGGSSCCGGVEARRRCEGVGVVGCGVASLRAGACVRCVAGRRDKGHGPRREKKRKERGWEDQNRKRRKRGRRLQMQGGGKKETRGNPRVFSS